MFGNLRDIMIEHATKILRISLDDWPGRDRLEALREVYGRTIMKHDIEPARGQEFYFRADLFRVPGLGLTTSCASPCQAIRRRTHVDNDDLVLTISERDGRILHQRGHELTLRQGDAVLTSGADTGVTTVAARTRWRSVRVNRAVLGPLIDLDACLMRPIPGNRPALRLLLDYVALVMDKHQLESAQLQQLFTTHVHDLVALVLGANRDGAELAQARGLRAARLHAIKSDISRRFGDEHLSVSDVARRHGVTPRYVHMLFEAEGRTFTEFLIERRLTQAHRMLTDPQLADRNISAVAFKVGFANLSYFNRLFRRRYGASPSDVRAGARASSRRAAIDDANQS